ncbi:hypothetical protein MP228_009869 [Amoeboaphelidium protococcarum]|nr:hypothetical protein MP228_009869 [Amoeboaphelidium protococcarum]
MSTESLISVRSTDTPKELNEAQHSVKVSAYHLHQKLKVDLSALKDAPARLSTTMDALKYAAQIVNELRHTFSPKDYYELYMSAFDHLQGLQIYLTEYSTKDADWKVAPNSSDSQINLDANGQQVIPEGQSASSEEVESSKENSKQQSKSGANSLNPLDKIKKTDSDLYEIVQYQTAVLPRMYLLITVGCVYAQLKPESAEDYLSDMLEMCRGIQHPTRGLFLRYYLQQCTKQLMDSLPLEKAVEFLLTNFTEMNKLWVRMQYQGLSRDRPKREQERKELRLLVGLNLVRLSQLPDMTLDLYKSKILPRVLEQIVSCKDVIAQEYLMEAISQVFSDEFHLGTLDELLSAIGKFNPQVSIKNIVISFVDRLVAYFKQQQQQEEGSSKQSSSQESEAGKVDFNLFEVFWQPISAVLSERLDLPMDDVTALLISMLNIALNVYGDQLDFVHQIFKFAAERFKQAKIEELSQHATKKLILEFIRLPLDIYPSILTVLRDDDLSKSYGRFICIQPFNVRQAASIIICNKMIEKRFQTSLVTQSDVQLVFGEYLNTMVKDQPDGQTPDQTSDFFADEQNLLCRVMLLVNAELAEKADSKDQDLDQKFVLLGILKKFIQEGGSMRMKYTIPTFVTLCTQLSIEYASVVSDAGERNEKLGTLFKFLHQTISLLGRYYPLIALKYYLYPLEANLYSKDQPSPFVGHEMAAYEFLVSAFSIYEDSVSQTHEQLVFLQVLIKIMYAISNQGVLGKDNYDTLSTKVALYCSRLLRKWDQARLVAKCSSLFWGREPVAQSVFQKAFINVDAGQPVGAAGGSATEDEDEDDDNIDSEETAGGDPFGSAQAGMTALSDNLDEMMIGGGWSEPNSATGTTAQSSFGQQKAKSGKKSRKDQTKSNASDLLPSSSSQQSTTALEVYRDPKRILECLQKALKIADACMDQLINAELFIDILNWYVHWFLQGVPSVTAKYVNGLIDLIFSNLQSVASDNAAGSLDSSVKSDGNMFGASLITGIDLVVIRSDQGQAVGDKQLPETPLSKIEAYFKRTLQHLQNRKTASLNGDEPSAVSSDIWRSIAVEKVLEQVTASSQKSTVVAKKVSPSPQS